MLCFSNPGGLDIRALTTLGVNVKDGESPIGFFGTGLKYAIAAGLRLGMSIEIHSGNQRFCFSTKTEIIRGKSFEIAYMQSQRPKFDNPDVLEDFELQLGWTTDFGKTWEPWMVYRELYSNTIDEGGEVFPCEMQAAPRPDFTNIYVSGLDQIHLERAKHFIMPEEESLLGNAKVQAFKGPSNAVFYRGIQVYLLPKLTMLKYNILEQISLTEDRTAKDIWSAKSIIARMLCESLRDKVLIEKILCCGPAFFEHDFDFDWSNVNYSEEFLDTALALWKAGKEVNESAMVAVRRERATAVEPKPAELTHVEQKMLARALDFLRSIGHNVLEPILVFEDLGHEDILAQASQDRILLTKRLFTHGTKHLARGILEEHIHIKHGYLDCSREMQNWLFDRVISLGEELTGEPV